MRALLRVDATVDVPAERLWERLVDWPAQGEWVPLTRVRTVGGSGRGIGGRLEAWTGIGPIGFDDPMVITRWEPPYSCEVLHTGQLVRGEAGFDVVAIGPSRSRVAWWESLELPLGRVGGLGWRLTAPLWHVLLRRALDRFRVLAESG
ncbi:MAG TPA: SRPBCC family protein [Nocardioidaceae bacterium]|nr:SRPBCC family protein [Nocardioidaceae bacterium]